MAELMRPKHVGISLFSEGDPDYSARKGASLDVLYSRRAGIVMEILGFQVEFGIPVVSMLVLPLQKELNRGFAENSRSLAGLFEQIKGSREVHGNQVKVSVLGKWYNLQGSIVESIKSLIEETKDYDRFFLNLCVNYGGQEEILDSCRVIALKVRSDKLDPENITREMIKENAYSSYFIPPDLIVKAGSRELDGFLLWDSPGARMHFTGRHWSELSRNDLVKAMHL
ncbi:undecaprenyl diphosphate synthase family protein [Candidatus Woesearchaeota archaeon]|nr:undecaprenyl diphosphate synthase family protein [Candidatus Woesearchaeota archaeon]